MKIQNAVAVGIMALTFGNAQAALIDRGGGLLYDNVLNVTWLQDANYAKTSGYNTTGMMTWNEATTWAADLSYHDSVRNVNLTDWRLAASTPVNGTTWDFNVSNNGSTDRSFNITNGASELAYMYYVNLGLKGFVSASGNVQSDWGVYGNGTFGDQADVGLVRNLQSFNYWTGTTWASYPLFFSLAFRMENGSQWIDAQGDPAYAWAVRSGDVAAVPEPETYAMMLAGLGLFGFMARRKKLA